ncbi:FYN-binding protein 1 isoform X1 [Corythoichthys intestinalis]|uniref:FYN-binding protein 1 isoform X1 n=1 Tax=Corythoichthys intestinalis TaxID=161448 RepID=UPI0025A5B244|nr:FYN-binding protein 1 isoform X1 [Corythoichthys intestinalis]
MENKADVKAIMARFQGNSDERSSPTPRHKAPVNHTLSSGPATPPKKPVLESLSGGTLNLTPKPSSYLKSAVTTKSDTEVLGENKTKALASRFSNTLDEPKKRLPDRGHTPLKPLDSKPEVKSPVLKPNLKPTLSATLSNPKPPGPKPTPPGLKPTLVKEEHSEGPPIERNPPKVPPVHRKPNSSIVKLRQHSETSTDKPSSPANFKAAQEVFIKEQDKSESDLNKEAETLSPVKSNPAVPPPKPPASKKPSIKKPPIASIPINSAHTDSDTEPKRNPLPNAFKLGPAPAKPKRPPEVDIDDFRRAAGIFTGNGTFNKTAPPIPPANHTGRPQQPQSALPSLPARPLGNIVHQDQSYDDVDAVMINSPSPPPLPSTAHPSLRPKEEEDDDSGDMYEPLDETWDEYDKQREIEEKRQREAEKKEQKGREKKEQEARKKFKLVGPVEVIHRGKARGDYKGSKTELVLKRGDSLDIIRVQGNPEGKWLGRKHDGSIGYVKTALMDIDFNMLKNQPAQHGSRDDIDYYDDVDVASSDSSGISGQGVFLPPPPAENKELYNDVDSDLDVNPLQPRSFVTKTFGLLKMFERNSLPFSTKVLPPPSQFAQEGNPVDDEIYYDVDAPSQPPLPPISSIPTLRGRDKTDEIDPKKSKKFEKEEKDFRKKFKYDGDIQVLYQVTVDTALANKKWGGKDLAVRAGEKLDVIVKPVDNKMICRNEDGKFGYVSTCQISMDDGEIYDDIGDDCIYDNDDE